MKAADIVIGQPYVIGDQGKGSRRKGVITGIREVKSRGYGAGMVKRVYFTLDERHRDYPTQAMQDHCTLAQVLEPWTDAEDERVREKEQARAERAEFRDRLITVTGGKVYVSSIDVRIALTREQAAGLLARLERTDG